ncbi:unnamed protein product [Symbiodinium sp. KB8]|nr:unnamed protein product [Symbiodinium sp. KB8]
MMLTVPMALMTVMDAVDVDIQDDASCTLAPPSVIKKRSRLSDARLEREREHLPSRDAEVDEPIVGSSGQWTLTKYVGIAHGYLRIDDSFVVDHSGPPARLYADVEENGSKVTCLIVGFPEKGAMKKEELFEEGGFADEVRSEEHCQEYKEMRASRVTRFKPAAQMFKKVFATPTCFIAPAIMYLRLPRQSQSKSWRVLCVLSAVAGAAFAILGIVVTVRTGS